MRKTLVAALVLLILALDAWSQEGAAPEKVLPFDIFVDQKIGLVRIDNWASNGFETKYAFTDAAKTFKLAYYLLPVSDNAVAYDAESIYILLGKLITRIAGDSASIDQISRYGAADVASLTNGEYGISSFVTNEQAETGTHYKYDHLSAFYKRGYGIVFQVITAKRLDFFKSPSFIDALKSFKYPGVKSK